MSWGPLMTGHTETHPARDSRQETMATTVNENFDVFDMCEIYIFYANFLKVGASFHSFECIGNRCTQQSPHRS